MLACMTSVRPSSTSGWLTACSSRRGQRRASLGRVARRDDDEAVALEPQQPAAGAERLLEPRAGHREERVAGGDAERLVDRAEAVEVEHHQPGTARRAGAGPARRRSRRARAAAPRSDVARSRRLVRGRERRAAAAPASSAVSERRLAAVSRRARRSATTSQPSRRGGRATGATAAKRGVELEDRRRRRGRSGTGRRIRRRQRVPGAGACEARRGGGDRAGPTAAVSRKAAASNPGRSAQGRETGPGKRSSRRFLISARRCLRTLAQVWGNSTYSSKVPGRDNARLQVAAAGVQGAPARFAPCHHRGACI